MQKIRDWIWDRLFLDFYLDKRWTWRFKLMNMLSGDLLRQTLSVLDYRLHNLSDVYEAIDDPVARKNVRVAQYWLDSFWEEVDRNAQRAA